MVGIYKFLNIITNEVYIGQSIFVEERIKQHLQKYNVPTESDYNCKFHKALREYGIENFTVEVIEECSLDELNEREIYWIEYYNSFSHGYNGTRGGKGSLIIDYKKVQDLWDSGCSRKEITNILNCSNCKGIKTFLSNYDDNYTQKAKLRGIKFSHSNANKIYQYDSSGNYISTFSTIEEAEQMTGINRSLIYKCCQNKIISAHNVQFSYQLTKMFSIEKRKKINKINNQSAKPVGQFLNDQLINIFYSATDAAKEVGGDNSWISKVCKSNKVAYGYFWKYLSKEEALAYLLQGD